MTLRGITPPASVGDGTGTPATTVTDERAFGISTAVGISEDYARADHTHGSPTEATVNALAAVEAAAAVVTHVALADPHVQYQRESEKDAALGYAGLSALSKLAGAQQTYGSGVNTACEGNDARLSDARTPLAHAHAEADVTGLVSDLAAKVPTARLLNTTAPVTGGGDLSADRTIAVSAATTTAVGVVELATDGEAAANVAVQGNDARMSNARTPTAHAASHQNGGGDEISVAGLSGLLADGQTPLAHNILTAHNGFPGGGTTFLRDDGTFASPGASSTNIKQTEVDFGATPVAEASFTITDADVSAGSQLIGFVAYEAPTGKDLDELEMDGLDLKFAPGTGDFTVYARGQDGYIADKFKLNYLIG